jgi:GTPase SAR1 family protein
VLAVFLILKSKKSKSNKREIALVGERGAGKTQLFISLCGGKQLESVPSIVNNTGILEIERNKYVLTDFIGDNISKEKIVS